jgi:hypothetical protein
VSGDQGKGANKVEPTVTRTRVSEWKEIGQLLMPYTSLTETVTVTGCILLTLEQKSVLDGAGWASSLTY